MRRFIGAVVYSDTNAVFGFVFPDEHEIDWIVLSDPQWLTHGDPNRPKCVIVLDRDNPDWQQFSDWSEAAGLMPVINNLTQR